MTTTTAPRSARRRARACIAGTAGAILALTGLGVSPAHADDPVTLPPSPAVMIGQMSGASGTTDTAATWKVTGADLGIMWDNGQGQILTAFGDTFGNWTGPGGGGSDWRSNVLLRSSDKDLSDGMSFDSAVTGPNGEAAELIPSKKQNGVEMTTIPTAGISVGTRQYMAYMSVKEWGPAGQWWTNYSRIAYSDDNGATWNSTDGPTWENTATASTWDDPTGTQDPFQMVAFAKRDGYVYMFGTPNGRLGAVSVARVAQNDMLDKNAWRYWDGKAWSAGPDTIAAPIVAPMNSELSVQYNAYTGKWLMVTLDGKAEGTMLLRTADNPEGPWSEGQGIANAQDYPGLYGGFIHPWSSGPDLYIAMSQWDPYNVFLVRVQLAKDGTIINPNLIQNPSFERSSTMTAPWACTGPCGIDTNYSWAYAGDRQAWMRNNTGTLDVHQDVTVQPNTEYVFSGFVTTGGATGDGTFGVRQVGPGAQILGSAKFTDVKPYKRFQITFNSGSSTSVEAFVGSTVNGDRWVQIDDLGLVKADPNAGTQPTPTPSVTPTTPSPTASSTSAPSSSAPVAPSTSASTPGSPLPETGAPGAGPSPVAPLILGGLVIAGAVAVLVRRRRATH